MDSLQKRKFKVILPAHASSHIPQSVLCFNYQTITKCGTQQWGVASYLASVYILHFASDRTTRVQSDTAMPEGQNSRSAKETDTDDISFIRTVRNIIFHMRMHRYQYSAAVGDPITHPLPCYRRTSSAWYVRVAMP